MKLIQQTFLQVSPLHQLHIARYGSPSGTPILFIHGGPGSKSKPNYLDYLPDNLPIHAILYDQRGCGLSQPAGEINQNTTQHLIQDIEKLRRRLNIDKWYVTGGSWGSTLALLYAQKHPKVVKGLILRNIFLARQKDNSWLYQPDGVGQFFPDKVKPVEKYLKKHNLSWDNLIFHAYQTLKTGSFNQQKTITALIYGWEHSLMSLDVPVHQTTPQEIDQETIASARIFTHYAANDFFIKNNQIIKNTSKIKHIPTAIIHGRYDMVCPLQQAYTLHQHLPNSQLFITNFAGHQLTWDGRILVKLSIKQLIQSNP
ncbi:MAG: prolyl aminopeptidase [bacterium]|nr:prolyl aminopeptidase [bacterium]